MTRKAKWAIIAFLVILIYGLAVVLLWDSFPRPYEKPPIATKEELRIMEKARKRHGNHTQIITRKEIYLERISQDGKPERVWVVKRRR